MFDLKEIILKRIQIFKSIPIKINNIHSDFQLNRRYSQQKLNKYILKIIKCANQQQKQRQNEESNLFDEIRQLRFFHKHIINEVCMICVDICQSYNPEYNRFSKYLNNFQSLKLICYEFFLNEALDTKDNKLNKIFKIDIMQSKPSLILDVFCEWSKNVFQSMIKTEISKQKNRHELQKNKGNNSISSKNLFQKQKSPLSRINSSQINKSCEYKYSQINLSNKESVYGLFLDELYQFYKLMPLDLDHSYFRTIKKSGRKKQLEQPEIMHKAVQILIQAKNKHIKQLTNEYKQLYDKRYGQREIISKSWQGEVKQKKKTEIKQTDLGRVKSQPQQQDLEKNYSRGSMLLCAKSKQISFEQSNRLMSHIKKRNQLKQLKFPVIPDRNKANGHGCKSAFSKAKQIKFSQREANCSVSSNYDRVITKLFVSPTTSKVDDIAIPTRKMHKNLSYGQTKNEDQYRDTSLEIEKKNENIDSFKKNRKLLLQLLRERNKNSYY